MPHIPDSRHADHDPLAIAAYAAGDATGAELQLASDRVASCADCAALHADLRAISAALPTIPAPVRPRDFTLTPEQAASLRPTGWRRFLAPLAGPRFAFAGPLGGGLATLGIAGLLLTSALSTPIAATAPGADGGGTAETPQELAASPGIEGTGPVAAAPAPSDRTSFKDPGASPAASGTLELAGLASPEPDESFEVNAMTGPGASSAGEPDEATALTDDAAAVATPPTVLPLVSIALLLVGVVLGGLWLAGRTVRPRT